METITFIANGVKYTAKAKRVNDAFFQITSGQWIDCWVHIWSVITPNYKEANEVSDDDLQAASDYYNKLKKRIK